MRQYHSATDWQSFITRKDIQSIARKLRRTQSAQYTVAIELLLVVVSVSFSNIFAEQSQVMNTYWLIVAIAAFVPFVVMFFVWIDQKTKKARTKRSLFTNRDYIDMFDNELCYYIMMAQSFYAEYIDLLKEPSETEQDKSIAFCYLQTTYYLNKTVDGLCSTQNDVKKVFSTDKHSIAIGRMVALVRLLNVLSIISYIYTNLNTESVHLQSNGFYDSYNDAMREYIVSYNYFLDRVAEKFTFDKEKYQVAIQPIVED